MSTNANEAKFRRHMVALDKHRKELLKPAEQRDPHKLMLPREIIKITYRCKICGRARSTYR